MFFLGIIHVPICVLRDNFLFISYNGHPWQIPLPPWQGPNGEPRRKADRMPQLEKLFEGEKKQSLDQFYWRTRLGIVVVKHVEPLFFSFVSCSKHGRIKVH